MQSKAHFCCFVQRFGAVELFGLFQIRSKYMYASQCAHASYRNCAVTDLISCSCDMNLKLLTVTSAHAGGPTIAIGVIYFTSAR